MSYDTLYTWLPFSHHFLQCFRGLKVVYFLVEHVIHMHIRKVMCFSAFMGGMKKRNKRSPLKTIKDKKRKQTCTKNQLKKKTLYKIIHQNNVVLVHAFFFSWVQNAQFWFKMEVSFIKKKTIPGFSTSSNLVFGFFN